MLRREWKILIWNILVCPFDGVVRPDSGLGMEIGSREKGKIIVLGILWRASLPCSSVFSHKFNSLWIVYYYSILSGKTYFLMSLPYLMGIKYGIQRIRMFFVLDYPNLIYKRIHFRISLTHLLIIWMIKLVRILSHLIRKRSGLTNYSIHFSLRHQPDKGGILAAGREATLF